MSRTFLIAGAALIAVAGSVSGASAAPATANAADTLVSLSVPERYVGRAALSDRRAATTRLAARLGLARGEVFPAAGVVRVRLGAAERARLGADPMVRGIHRLRVPTSSSDPAEPRRVGFRAGNWGLAAIKAPTAWHQWGVTGRGVRVGVIDTGASAVHGDLSGRIAAWRDFGDHSETPKDSGTHGSHVAGTVAGGRASGLPVGVAPDAELLVARVQGSNAQGIDLLSALRAMEWMTDPDGNPATDDWPRIVNSSWGGSDPTVEVFDEILALWRRMGIIPVFAAGNEGPAASTMGAPAGRPGVLAVGASDQFGALAAFSSRGPTPDGRGVDLLAPGVEITSSVGTESHLSFNGTSMAAPHVSGALALLAQARPGASAEELVGALRVSSRSIGGDPLAVGAGVIDVPAALASLGVAPRSGEPVVEAVAGPGRWTNRRGTLPFALARPDGWVAQGRINDGPWSDLTEGIVMIPAPETEGDYTVSLRATAPDGTQQRTVSVPLGIDRTAPQVSLALTRGRGIGVVRLRAAAVDARAGVSADQTSFVLNGKAPIGGQRMATDFTYDGRADRIHLAVSVADRAGNESWSGSRWHFPAGQMLRAWRLRTSRLMLGMMQMTLQNIALGAPIQSARAGATAPGCFPAPATLARKLRGDFRVPVRVVAPGAVPQRGVVSVWSSPQQAVLRLRVPGVRTLVVRVDADACHRPALR